MSGRFDKYRSESDWPALRKLEQGESFTATLVGDHEYEGKDGAVPVLELRNGDGEEFGWMAGGWHARDELALADPENGDVIEVRRLADRGPSYQYAIRIVQRASREEPPPESQPGEQFGDKPPW